MTNFVNDEDQWLLSAEEYSSLFTLHKKATTTEEEEQNRYKASGLIQAIGMNLKLPQTTIATAQVFMHRFYVRETFTHFPWRDTAAAMIFLAAKCEEHPRKLVDVLQTSQIQSNPTDSSISDEKLKALMERTMIFERIIMKTLCFDLSIVHPYKFVFQLVKELPKVPDELVQSAWIIVNDTFRTFLCIRYPPRIIAIAAITFAANKRQIPLKEGLFDCPPDLVHDICQKLHALYHTNNAKGATTNEKNRD